MVIKNWLFSWIQIGHCISYRVLLYESTVYVLLLHSKCGILDAIHGYIIIHSRVILLGYQAICRFPTHDLNSDCPAQHREHAVTAARLTERPDAMYTPEILLTALESPIQSN